MEINYRKCDYDDVDFILDLKDLCIRWYIEIIYGWDYDVQRKNTIQELNHHIDGIRIMLDEDKPIGVTTFYEEDGNYIVGLIALHPDYQGQGIGSEILSKYIEKAKDDRKKIYIKAYKGNPARLLYERLGFKKYREDDTHVYSLIDFSI